MSNVTRRDFLARSTAAIGAMGAAASWLANPTVAAAASFNPRRLTSGADQVTLGRTGIKSSLIGMGTGSVGVKRSSNQVKLGQEKFTFLVRHAIDSGITYFDTADQYGSHIFLREALRGVPRDKLFIQTKTRATSAEVARADLDRFREELGTEYIDSLLMHCMTKGSWPTDFRPVMDVLSDAKSKGWVRAVGVSCHGMDPLRVVADCDWVEIDLARINPAGVAGRMDGTPDEVVPCLEAMHRKGKGILGMKILGEGTFKSVEQQIASLRFVLGLGTVDAMVVGFETPEQIDQIMTRVQSALKA
jgi:predicted aldo/keto reductase-like oxidoreductase